MSRDQKPPVHRGQTSLVGEMAGEYRIRRVLGAGGFGTVYEAEHPLLKRRAAVKVLHQNRSLHDDAVQRFIAEAQAASQIRHPNIVPIFSFGELKTGQLFYAMDLLDGAPMDAYLKEQGRLAPDVVIALIRPVASALDALHAANIVHRDVKPANVFLSWETSGEVVPKLLDFGLIKLLGETPIHTASGALMGTPFYMAPEQCVGEKVDARSDVYSLGVIVWELCAGRVPYTGETAAAVLLHHVMSPPPRLSEAVPGFPTELDAPVLAMMAKDPGARPASAGDAITALENAARESGRSPASLHLPRPTPRAEEEAPSDGARAAASVAVLSTSLGPQERDASSPKGGRNTLIYGAIAALVVCIGLLVWLLGVDAPPPGTAASAVPAPVAPVTPSAEPSVGPQATPAEPVVVAAPAAEPSAPAAPSASGNLSGHTPPAQRPKKRGTVSRDLENPF